MNETIVQKIESRIGKNKEWRLINKDGHFLNVSFSINLENNMKKLRNFSFNRFESEQLNELSKLVPSLTADYNLHINQELTGSTYLPVSAENAVSLFEKIN
ncbi:hypothetical protein [Ligilactobacillus sp. Marseille-Q7487]|jgi:protein tyrosine/serine phosphatase|uniref:hypothetical protein n=1 Tax=Ligilactobacillus sp. Marseille-Q7487 TaxID=3022128 RepID=UPI0015B5FF42|nr:hypothetical protein [Ligilactobacillus sp. Marseille-Q7487]